MSYIFRLARDLFPFARIREWAERLQGALRTLRDSGLAHFPPMEDHEVGKQGPMFMLPDLHEVMFNFDRIHILREAQSARETTAMGVHHDARNTKTRPEHHVGGLASHTRQFHQRVERLRHLSPMLFDDPSRGRLNILRLVVIKTAGLNVFLEVFNGSFRVVFRSRKGLEQCRGDLVHTNIRTLRREYRRHHEFKRVRVVQRTLSIWILRVQQLEYVLGAISIRAYGQLEFPHREQRYRAHQARKSSVPSVFNTSPGSSHPLRAMPIPYPMRSIAPVLCASGLMQNLMPLSLACRT